MPQLTDAQLDKASLRTLALARRAALDPAARAEAAEAAAANAMEWLGGVADEVVSVFSPIGGEIATDPLVRRLREAGARVALPIVLEAGKPLLFRLWEPGTELEPSLGPGRFSIPAPPESAPAVSPDVLVVPLAGFDARGNRLGYGAGFYDRTLSLLRRAKRIEALGYAFAVQQLAAVPAEPHDERLDAIATDAGIVRPAED
ncbi:5-formyltetrahydrofolate cyclo-ligase [Ancylobacter rudongensis]|uniref:5-formyltetrahydrofolate cyclo-ligase n=1 Tax=Ancylobacter rudongensis TaxID=177413 RepID=A0A1G4TYC7_9HYPH|nr:5-formyltetrahydrofolate cyclo-ligase [Ancylobacter rudongensis]SCW85655.1 5-formyltetrahydrofolate cyclo-ligase [Ancylobacter rudongensis]